MTISAVVNTYNEEKNIRRCLTSLAWADELIVVDMGSTDETRTIAKACGARVIDHPYVGYVEPARNVGIAAAKGSWIVLLDADEVLPPTLASYLQKTLPSTAAQYLRIARQNQIFGTWIRHTGWWPDYQIRVFQKDAVTWSEKLHGIPMTRGTGTDVEASEELSIIHHHYTSISQYLERLNRYTAITAAELHREGTVFTPSDLFTKPTREFIQRFFVWEGYKDGVHGLGLSFLQSFSELIVALKLWELEKYKKHTVSVENVARWRKEEDRQLWYWIVRHLRTSNPFSRLYWKLKQKIASL